MSKTIQLPSKELSSRQGFLSPIGETVTPPIPIEGIVKVGRHPENDVVLADPHVSLYHCQLERRPHGYFIRDLKSSNGTSVDGVPVQEAKLEPQARIKIGTREFEFRIPDENHLEELPMTSKNPVWLNAIKSIPQMAQTDLPVFLRGESGSGKEVVARLVHSLSSRNKGPFVSVNCSALSESLVESELFGHVRGSFTGATADRKGAFQEARGGTLFLDEIGDLSPNLQPKLLRALENREIRPVGSDRTLTTDVRIITATHKSLKELIKQELFRSDLYFRIHVLSLNIPPLRQRMEDFEGLVYQFAKEMRVRFSVSAMELMKYHTWPGNIRELKNTVARIGALYPGVHIQAEHVESVLEGMVPQAGSLLPEPQTLSNGKKLPLIKEFEKELIRQRLEANRGNQRKTAKDLGMAKSTLHDRIRTYGIKFPDEQQNT